MKIEELLSSPLIQKYFGCEIHYRCEYDQCRNLASYRILRAMCEPIDKGDKCIWLGYQMKITVYSADYAVNSFPRMWLRLPDNFQEKKECPICNRCGKPLNQYEATVIDGSDYWERACIHMRKQGETAKFEAKCEYNPPFINSCDCGCHGNGCTNKHERGACCSDKPDPVEEKIEELIGLGDTEHSLVKTYSISFLRNKLRELVRLARESK